MPALLAVCILFEFGPQEEQLLPRQQISKQYNILHTLHNAKSWICQRLLWPCLHVRTDDSWFLTIDLKLCRIFLYCIFQITGLRAFTLKRRDFYIATLIFDKQKRILFLQFCIFLSVFPAVKLSAPLSEVRSAIVTSLLKHFLSRAAQCQAFLAIIRAEWLRQLGKKSIQWWEITQEVNSRALTKHLN